MLDTSSNPLLALILWSDAVQPPPRMALSILVPLLLPCPGSTLFHQAPQRPGAWRRSLAFQPTSSSCGRSYQGTKPSLCFPHRHSKSQKSNARCGPPTDSRLVEKAPSLAYFRGRQRVQKSDQHEVQILSKAAAVASGALMPGDRAKICIKQFTALTTPGFNGIGRC